MKKYKGLTIRKVPGNGKRGLTYHVEGVLKSQGGLPQHIDTLVNVLLDDVARLYDNCSALSQAVYLHALIDNLTASLPRVDDTGKGNFTPAAKMDVPNYNKGYNENLRKRIQARRNRIKITKLKAKTKNKKI